MRPIQMGKHSNHKIKTDEVDVVIPMTVLDAAVAELIKCNDTETLHVLDCRIDRRIDEYFKRCLNETKKKKRRNCEFETTYVVIGEDMEEDEDDGQ